MYGFIYITTNNINGKKYLGQRIYDKNGRWKNYLGSGLLIKKAIKKYGSQNFTREIITEAKTREELNQIELELVEKYNCRNSENWYNIFKGGKGGSLKGEDSQNFGRTQTEDHRSKISKGMNGTKIVSKPFKMTDLETDEVFNFETLGEVTVKFGPHFRKAASVHLCYKKDKNVKPYKGRYKFEYTD